MDDGAASAGGDVDVRLTGHEVEQFATDRVIGRRLLPADLDFLVELHQDPEVMATRGGVRTAAATEPFVRSNVAHWRHYQFGLYILSLADEPDEPIGRAGLRWDRHAGPAPAVDVSIVLAEGSWGSGIGTEAARAVVAIGIHLDVPLVAGCEHDHRPAIALVERVGFERAEGYTHHNRPWVRYRWPANADAPATLLPRTGRP